MLIQGEHLLMRNLIIRSLQILHMEKNQRLMLKPWHHLMLLSGLQQNAMSLTNLLDLMFMTSLYYHLVVHILDADGSIKSSVTLKGIPFSTELTWSLRVLLNALVRTSSRHLLLWLKSNQSVCCLLLQKSWTGESMSLMLTWLSSTEQCLKTKLSISPNLLAMLPKERKTSFGNWAKHSMA